MLKGVIEQIISYLSFHILKRSINDKSVILIFSCYIFNMPEHFVILIELTIRNNID